MGIHVGIKENSKLKIFESDTSPTKERHPEYDFAYGPFKTLEDAQKYVNSMGKLICGEG